MDKKTVLITAGVGVAGVVVGGGVGYLLTARFYNKLLGQVNDAMGELLVEADQRARFDKTGPYATPEGAAEILLSPEELEVKNQGLRDMAAYHTLVEDYSAEGGIENVEARTDELQEVIEQAEDEIDAANEDLDDQSLQEMRDIINAGRQVEPVRTITIGGVEIPEDADDTVIAEIMAAQQAAAEDAEDDTDLNDQIMVTIRTPERPYEISVEEYSNPQSGQSSIGLTYWEGDDVLMDEGGSQIADIDRSVGRHNLELFGNRSQDPNVVYVRNEPHGVDYEVTKNEGSFSEFVGKPLPKDGVAKSRKMRDDE